MSQAIPHRTPLCAPTGIAVLRTDELLSMAIVVMLERLTPSERAVFLLREIFSYEYADITTALGLSEGDSRQSLRRALEQVRAVRPRFRASPLEHLPRRNSSMD
jgi:RNA polymerase sigma-70 factor, ECF subfamily